MRIIGTPPNLVTVDGRRLDPGPSQRVRNHSPDGFAWGYGGSGPSQLALAILLCALPTKIAEQLYQDFKREYIAPQPMDHPWELHIDIDAWAAAKLTAERTTRI